jgi:hypothetical protein
MKDFRSLTARTGLRIVFVSEAPFPFFRLSGAATPTPLVKDSHEGMFRFLRVR